MLERLRSHFRAPVVIKLTQREFAEGYERRRGAPEVRREFEKVKRGYGRSIEPVQDPLVRQIPSDF
jgi:hypothetical protein